MQKFRRTTANKEDGYKDLRGRGFFKDRKIFKFRNNLYHLEILENRKLLKVIE